MGTAKGATTWPADVIHVNEDGWVLINRGREQGVLPGLRLLVVGQGIRELHDLYAAGDASATAPVLRIRRTYEQLEVIHTEARCSIAIAARTPPERRPIIYQGPEGELLVWAPLPPDFTWPRPGEGESDVEDEETSGTGYGAASGAWQGDGEASNAQGADQDEAGATPQAAADTPPEHGEQDDERWEHALPLNGVSVGDIVLPAIPAASGASASAAAQAIGTAGGGGGNPFESGRRYDWMAPGS